MIRSFRGAFIAISLVALGGCFAPMTTREAQQIASNQVTQYCAGRCGALTVGHTQKIKNRWLVDLDATRQKFTVIVETDGNSKLTAWDKP
jgi:hypothetical protein